jgi:hypothetical protein
MPLPWLIAGLLGKAAASSLVKGLTAKAAAGGAKGLIGHHGHHRVALELARTIARDAAEHAAEAGARKVYRRLAKRKEAPRRRQEVDPR